MITTRGRTARRSTAVTAALLAHGLTACAEEDPAAAPGDTTGPVAVKATDSECALSRGEVKAGTSTFTVSNGGSKVTEFYVYAEGDRVMGEVENIGPGLKRDLIVELPSGRYQAVCKPGMVGTGIRGDLTVSGAAAAQVDGDTALKQATESYQRYVNSQAVALEERTTEFVMAVKAGDVAKAKALFPVAAPTGSGSSRSPSRSAPWTRRSTPARTTSSRARSGPASTGLRSRCGSPQHDQGMEKYADQLLVDIKTVVAKAKVVQLNPLQLANGAKELLDEVATGKITGEEDRYSHTDLWDFQANVEGSKAAVQALRPALQQRDPALVATLDAKFRPCSPRWTSSVPATASSRTCRPPRSASNWGP
jgi:iron uptake system component EfeO